MISPELLRRYPFFAGLTHEHLVILADAAEEMSVETGYTFFKEEDKLDHFYLLVKGSVGIGMAVPDRDVKHNVSGQLLGELQTKNVVVSTIGTGDVFAWSALIPPNFSTAGGTALTDCQVIAFDAVKLRRLFEEQPDFGYLMSIKAGQLIRGRLRDLRIESLATYTN
ncbi:MAG: cyclic nucleotide-binding domain-containing protein [Anaerolineales bacterium]|nr:cyclic nucleotide-binding domain-containing protein [Anaerolineales bacterium]MCA9927256.1 cyclic nucleotide-binding domain-containing protein [Anaerolineales bacterium]